jgi:hypothetical protein
LVSTGVDNCLDIPVEELERLNKRMRCVREQDQRQRRKNAYLGLTARMVKVVVVAYVLSEYSAVIASEVARALCQSHNGPSSACAMQEFPIRDWFMEVSGKEPDMFYESETKIHISIRNEAAKLVSEIRSILWVRDQNFDRCVAPSVESVVNKYAEHLKDVDLVGGGPSAAALVAAAASISKPGRRWATRWCQNFRKRWGVSKGGLPCLEVVPKPELRDRAPISEQWVQLSHSVGSRVLQPISENSACGQLRCSGYQRKVAALFCLI